MEGEAPDRVIDCPVCGAAAFTRLFVKRDQQFVKCAGCGLVLINPRPFLAALRAVYDEHYSGGYIRKADSKKKRARQRVALLQRRFGLQGRWLDVGCSAGFLVAAAAAAGFDACGVDVEEAGIAYARETLGLANVHCGPLEAIGLPGGAFNVIAMYDVIEHVPDLNQLVPELKRLLAPGGVLHVRTPDVGHWRRPRDLSAWSEVKPSEHLYYFDKRTLPRLLARHGLRLRANYFTWKSALSMVFEHA